MVLCPGPAAAADLAGVNRDIGNAADFEDHGASWHKLDEGRSSTAAVHPEHPHRVCLRSFAADVTRERTNVYRSADGGRTWTEIADDIPLRPGGEGDRITFDPSDPSRFFLTHNSRTYEGVER